MPEKNSEQNDVCEVFCVNKEKVERLKDEVESTKGLALLFKALADDTRVKIAYALSREELCVCDVAAIIGSNIATASHHLRFLRNLGLARQRKEGKFVYYSIGNKYIEALIETALEHATREKPGILNR
ncbi:MAG: winged helix-turn-helix transcriptional regulator [Pelotomaculum sp.]|nr:winged helix-turn-helix transcriptional regulator [Pelotomaculum sp.]NPV74538.1 winged helix-turn-helix transcriptional regulator [Pelotomaculum sp.]